MRLTTSKLPRVIRFGSHNTRRNLPAASASKRREINFLAQFERAYFAQAKKPAVRAFAAGREFGLDGYGRADLLWLAWARDDDEFSAVSLDRRIRLTAIEAKMKD